jgi:regulation of enolase protein 1 (concanavalin A-like superfamily)
MMQLARYCGSPFVGVPSVGLAAQSPAGPGVTARFTDITVGRHAIDSLRDGS